MGLTRKPIAYIFEMLELAGLEDFHKLSLAQIGDQTVRLDTRRILPKYTGDDSFYTGNGALFFRKLGFDTTTFDIQEWSGVTKVDLRSFLSSDYYNKFDVVSNIGTTEHVDSNQYVVFKNIHDICKLTGIMIHILPAVGSRKGHGFYLYSDDFFLNLKKCMRYKVLDHRITPIRYGERFDRNYIFWTVQKVVELPFMDMEFWKDPVMDDVSFSKWGVPRDQIMLGKSRVNE